MNLSKQLSELIQVNKDSNIKKLSYTSENGECLEVEFNPSITQDNNEKQKKLEEHVEPTFAQHEQMMKEHLFGQPAPKTDLNTPLVE